MIKPSQALDINFLKNNNHKIHFFGLGFIQIKLSDMQRAHYYTNKLNSTVNDEDIHNHRYDFTSQVLKGSLTQETFTITKGSKNSKYVKKQESCSSYNKIESKSVPVTVLKSSIQYLNTGSSYFIDHNTFHKVSSNSAVTLLTRSCYKKKLADVIYNINEIQTCPFSNNVSEDILWKIVEEIIND